MTSLPLLIALLVMIGVIVYLSGEAARTLRRQSTTAVHAPLSVNGPLPGVFTERYDNSRVGANKQEVILTPSNVTPGRFGKLFSFAVDGQVYAQPLYMQNVSIPGQGAHNLIFVATQHDSVYAFDAEGASTAPIWQVNFLNAAAGVTTVPAADVYPVGSFDIDPEIGITSTPVIDPASGALFVMAKTRELKDPACTSNCKYNYIYRLHALDVATGAEKAGGPVAISARVPGTGYDNVAGIVTFGGFRCLQRPGLLLLNGTVYAGFASQGDASPFHGWLLGYDAATLNQAAVFNVTPNGQEGGIWQSGGGIAADADGSIYVVTANGTFDADKGLIDYGDSVLRLQVRNGRFYVVDYFTPANQSDMDAYDWDLGSAPPLLLPDQPGRHPHLLVTVGKDSRMFMLDRDALGHQRRHDAGALQVRRFRGMNFGGGTYWNGNLYLEAVGDNLRQFRVVKGLAQTPIVSSFAAGFPNPTLTISSHGSADGILWFVQADAYASKGPAILHAFDATDVRKELYNSSQAPGQRDQAGPAVKFVTPTVANGKVYVGTAAEVDAYGLLK